VDVLSSEGKTVILLTSDSFTDVEDQEELQEQRRLEDEANRIEEEAAIMAFRQMQGPWEKLDPTTRLEYRTIARRKLGL
jgi:hypothetical protein